MNSYRDGRGIIDDDLETYGTVAAQKGQDDIVEVHDEYMKC